MPILYGYSFLHAFDRRPYAVHEQVKIIQDFLEVYIYIYILSEQSKNLVAVANSDGFFFFSLSMSKCENVKSGAMQASKSSRMQRKAWRNWL